jgi:hypothetical protein
MDTLIAWELREHEEWSARTRQLRARDAQPVA